MLFNWFKSSDKVDVKKDAKVKLEPSLLITEEERTALYHEAVYDVQVKRLSTLVLHELNNISGAEDYYNNKDSIENIYGKIIDTKHKDLLNLMYPNIKMGHAGVGKMYIKEYPNALEVLSIYIAEEYIKNNKVD